MLKKILKRLAKRKPISEIEREVERRRKQKLLRDLKVGLI